VQTPRFCGHCLRAGEALFVRTFSRPFLTSWLIVGIWFLRDYGGAKSYGSASICQGLRPAGVAPLYAMGLWSMKPHMKVRSTLIATVLLSVPVPAHADDWIVAEAPAAIAVSAAQEGVFRPGAMPAIGVYRDNGVAAFGLRMRVGVPRRWSGLGK
jgi:hypothetical protein